MNALPQSLPIEKNTPASDVGIAVADGITVTAGSRVPAGTTGPTGRAPGRGVGGSDVKPSCGIGGRIISAVAAG